MLTDRINATARRVPTAVVYVGGLVPLALLVWHAATNGLGPDPVRALEQQLGELALQFLVAGLVISPIRWSLGWNLIRFRRALGLLAFAYVTLHLLTWGALDLALRWSEIGTELVKRPYIILGMIGFVAMVPLAATSNTLSIRRMGAAAWGQLHRLTYVAALAGALHYIVLVKAWPLEPILYLTAVLGLLGWRALRARSRLVRQTA